MNSTTIFALCVDITRIEEPIDTPTPTPTPWLTVRMNLQSRRGDSASTEVYPPLLLGLCEIQTSLLVRQRYHDQDKGIVQVDEHCICNSLFPADFHSDPRMSYYTISHSSTMVGDANACRIAYKKVKGPNYRGSIPP